MSQASSALIDLAQDAISLELNGEHFYRRAIEATGHAKGKAMFRRLAEQEQGHVDEIKELFEGLINDEEWESAVVQAHARPRTSPVIAQLEATIAARGHSDVADDTQALRLAMELERRAAQFFEDLMAYTDDSAKRKMIRKLVDEEHFHYDILQAQLDSVLNVGIWLDGPEFRQDGKF